MEGKKKETKKELMEKITSAVTDAIGCPAVSSETSIF